MLCLPIEKKSSKGTLHYTRARKRAKETSWAPKFSSHRQPTTFKSRIDSSSHSSEWIERARNNYSFDPNRCTLVIFQDLEEMEDETPNLIVPYKT